MAVVTKLAMTSVPRQASDKQFMEVITKVASTSMSIQASDHLSPVLH
jgi:hypothetical protein